MSKADGVMSIAVKQRFREALTRTGRLRKVFKPAVYFDSSVLIDYWCADGLELEVKDEMLANELREFLRDLLKADARIAEVGKIRKAVLIDGTRIRPITCPLAILELFEWHANAALKDEGSRAVGAHALQHRSRKEIGDLLKRLTDLADIEAKKHPRVGEPTPVEILTSSTWLNPSFLECHGLAGIIEADLVGFGVTRKEVWSRACALSYYQVGMADVLHVLAASHLGCEYFASFDSDFRRISDILRDEFALKLVSSSQELLQLLSQA